MRVIIKKARDGILPKNTDIFDAESVSFDLEKRYAVAELYKKELFIALKVISDKNDILTGEYADHYTSSDAEAMLTKYSVDWGNIKYGFCKLELWAPELANKFGGSFSKTVKRFYFDFELYKTKYEKINGVPCKKKRP